MAPQWPRLIADAVMANCTRKTNTLGEYQRIVAPRFPLHEGIFSARRAFYKRFSFSLLANEVTVVPRSNGDAFCITLRRAKHKHSNESKTGYQLRLLCHPPFCLYEMVMFVQLMFRSCCTLRRRRLCQDLLRWQSAIIGHVCILWTPLVRPACLIFAQ